MFKLIIYVNFQKFMVVTTCIISFEEKAGIFKKIIYPGYSLVLVDAKLMTKLSNLKIVIQKNEVLKFDRKLIFFVQEPAAKMLAHRQPVRSVAVDRSGNYLATSATDKTLKIWDIRAFKCLQEYRVGTTVFKRA